MNICYGHVDKICKSLINLASQVCQLIFNIKVYGIKKPRELREMKEEFKTAKPLSTSDLLTLLCKTKASLKQSVVVTTTIPQLKSNTYGITTVIKLIKQNITLRYASFCS